MKKGKPDGYGVNFAEENSEKFIYLGEYKNDYLVKGRVICSQPGQTFFIEGISRKGYLLQGI